MIVPYLYKDWKCHLILPNTGFLPYFNAHWFSDLFLQNSGIDHSGSFYKHWNHDLMLASIGILALSEVVNLSDQG